MLGAIMAIVGLTACGGGGGGKKSDPPVTSTNSSPTVQAGDKQTVDEQVEVSLTSEAQDSDGSIVTYSWRQLSGESVSLSSSNQASTSFLSPITTVNVTLEFELTVTDNENATAIDRVEVDVLPVNLSPVASAGVDQTVDEQTQVSLIGTGTDSDGSIVVYQWRQVSGVSVIIEDAGLSQAQFIAPTVSGLELAEFELMVTDNETATDIDVVRIEFLPVNDAPVVILADEITVIESSTVYLDATVGDPDGQIMGLQWTQASGVPVILNGVNQAQVNFIAPVVAQSTSLVFHMTATDNEDATTTESITVIVNNYPRSVLNDTGVNECANFGDDRTCPSSDIPGQDADYGRDALARAGNIIKQGQGNAGFDFSKLDSSGAELANSAVEWSCIRDNVTSLVWEIKTTVDGLHLNTNTYSWLNGDESNNGGDIGLANGGVCIGSQRDTESFVNAVNEASYCGFSDWRIASYLEFDSINDYGIGSVDPSFFPNYPTTLGGYYWTSNSLLGSKARDFSMDFGNHSVSAKTNARYVRLVRSVNQETNN